MAWMPYFNRKQMTSYLYQVLYYLEMFFISAVPIPLD